VQLMELECVSRLLRVSKGVGMFACNISLQGHQLVRKMPLNE
jgi:hypothetical protein